MIAQDEVKRAARNAILGGGWDRFPALKGRNNSASIITPLQGWRISLAVFLGLRVPLHPRLLFHCVPLGLKAEDFIPKLILLNYNG